MARQAWLGIWLAGILTACGPLLGQLPDDSEPTLEDLYGKENTITMMVTGGGTYVIPTNGHFRVATVAATEEIPRHTVLTGSGSDNGNSLYFRIIQDGDQITPGGYDGVSSIFSLDGLVYYDLVLDGKSYSSLEYGEGAGGTTVYYNSFMTIKTLKIDRRANADGRVFELKAAFKAYLRESGKENKTAIIVDGTINYVNYP